MWLNPSLIRRRVKVDSSQPNPDHLQATPLVWILSAQDMEEIDIEAMEGRKSAKPYKRQGPFRFLDLPYELRLRVYDKLLHVNKPIDLDPSNFINIARKLTLFTTCKQVHEEASRVFYSQTVRLFPKHGRFFHTKKPLLARIPVHYRKAITTVQIVLGPGWSNPPRGQNTGPSLGLADCVSLRTLKLFVECDPSDSVFTGFRGKGATEDTYKAFCISLIQGVLDQVPSLVTVEIDAYPSVQKTSPIVVGLRRHIEQNGKLLRWGPSRGWKDDGDRAMLRMESSLSTMSIQESSNLVDVPA